MQQIENLKKELISLWKNDIKKDYEEGLICSERHLQALIFHYLMKKFECICEYKIWLEPLLTGSRLYNLKGTKPDLLITYKNEIICFVELKYVPYGYVNYHKDLNKISSKYNPKINLYTESKSGDWDYKKYFKFNENILKVFGVIANCEAAALSIEHISVPGNFLHLFGSVELNKSIFDFNPKQL